MVITSWLAALSSKLFGKKKTPRTRSQQSKLAAQASQASETLEERTLMTVVPVIDIYAPNAGIDEDHVFSVPAPGVLANDPAGLGTRTTIQATNTAVGVALLSSDGSFVYTPGASLQSLTHGEISIQEFTYKVADAGDFGPDAVGPTAIVRLYVMGLNDAPTATNATQSVNYSEDGGLQNIGAIVADDADLHDVITATLSLSDSDAGTLSAPGATFNLGVLSITGEKATVNAALAAVKFTPNANYDKNFHIDVSIADGGEDGAVPYTGVITMTANPVNEDSPTASGGTLTVDEDSGANPGMLIGTDPDTNPASTLTYSLVAGASHGTVIITDSTTGAYTYTPAPDYFGSDGFTFEIMDTAAATSNIAGVSITVTSVNDVPIFTVGSDQPILEDAGAQSVPGFATGIAAGGANEDGQTFDFIVTNDNNSLFSVQPSIDSNGKLTYTPAANQNGSALVTVQIHDDGGTANGGVDTSSTQTFTIDVTAVNDVPSFTVGATQTTLEDAGAQSVTGFISIFSVGPANESSQTPDFVVTNDNNSLFSVQPTIDATGKLTYTAAADANGSATVTVYIHDDGGSTNGGVDTSATQTFTINITPVNDAPSFTKGGDESVDEDTSLHTVNGWATALVKGPANESGQTLSFGVTTDNDALFSTGPAVDSSGNLTYTLAANRFGTAVVTVTLHDNGGTANGGSDSSAPQTFNIVVANINDVPTFTVGPTQTTNEDAGAQSVTGFISTFSPGPFESDTVDFVVTNDNNALFSVQPAIDATGKLTYTAAADANGSATVTVYIHDDGGTANGGVDQSSTQTFTLNITAVNDAPAFTKGADETVLEDSGLNTVTGWATGMSVGPANESGQSLTTFHVSTSNDSLFSVLPAIDTTTGDLTYTLAPNAFGSAVVTVTLSDDGGSANGGNDTSAPQTFNINVTGVNDAPSFTVGPTETSLEDGGAKSVTGFISTFSPGPGESDNVNFVVTNDNNALFSVQPAIDATGKLTYTAAADANGSATVTVYIHDDGGTANGGVDQSSTQTFTLNITAVNDAPAFTKGADESVLEDSGLNTVTGWATGMSVGPANESGQSLTTFHVSTSNDSLFSVLPAIDTTTGDLTYTLAPNAFGSAVVTVTLSDDGGSANGGNDTSAPQTFNINVTGVNDAPSFTVGPTETSLEDGGAKSVTGFISTFSPGPGESDNVNFVVTNDNNALFSVQPAIDATGKLTYTAAADANGSATVTVYIHDDGGTANGGVDQSSTQTFTLNITAVNDAPAFTKGADESVLEDTTLHTVNGWATGITKGPTADENTQNLTFNVSNDNNALFSVQPAIDASGNLTYTLAANAFGTATVTVTLSDDGGTLNGGVDTSASQTFDIVVTNVNDAPSFTKGGDESVYEDTNPHSVANWATAISAGPNEGSQTVTFNVTNNDNPTLFSVAPAISANGTLTYTLAPNANGTANITITLSDNGGTLNSGADTSGTQTFAIVVNPVNDAPAFTKGADESVLEDTTLHTVNGWATGITKGPTADENTQNLTFNVSNDNNALFSVQPAIDASGNLTYTLAANAFGTATVTVTLSDDGGTLNGGVDTSASQTFDIVVTGVNDAPAFTKGTDETVFEDTDLHTVANWATGISAGPGEGSQTLTFNVTNNDNPSLFSVAPAIAADGTLTYTLAPNANGTAMVTITLSDSGGTLNGGSDTSGSQTFAINVIGVNDAPAFTKGADEEVLEDSGVNGAHTVVNWATDITKGPTADENSQALTFIVDNDNHSLFAVQPTLNSSGSLTYTLNPNAFGTAVVTVTLMDNGGTSDGGVNTSDPQTFNIVVTGVNDAPTFTMGPDQIVNEDSHSCTTNLITNGGFEGGLTGWTTFGADSEGFGDNNFYPQTGTETPLGSNPDGPDFVVAAPPEGTDAAMADQFGPGYSILYQNFVVPTDIVAATLSLQLYINNHNIDYTDPSSLVGVDAANQQARIDLLTGSSAIDSTHPSDVLMNLFQTHPGDAANYGYSTLTADLTTFLQAHAGETLRLRFATTNTEFFFEVGVDDVQLNVTHSATHTVSNWATDLSTGGSGETQNLTFNVTNDNNSLFAVQPAIDPVTGDLTYTLTPNANGTATVSVVLMDDGGSLNGGVDRTDPQTFTISVNAKNDAPEFTTPLYDEVLEDTGAHSVTGFATGMAAGPASATDESSQVLNFIVSNDNNSLFTVQPSINPTTGTLTYTLAANAHGNATVTVTLHDDGGSAYGGQDSYTRYFTIVVDDVNDAPTFSLPGSPDQTILEDAGAQTVAGFATGISAGPDEGDQQLEFIITTSDDSKFDVLPQIDPITGDLTYTPAANANGTVTVSVTLYDDGDIDHGGIDQSTTKTFTIHITPVNDAPVAVDETGIVVFEDGSRDILVLRDATEVDGDPLVITIATDPSHGIATVDDNGTPLDYTDDVVNYQPFANYNGPDTFTYTITDPLGLSSTATITMNVISLNDDPTFTLGTNPAISEDAGAQTINGFITAISPGPADESGQSVTFSVTNDNNSLFSVQPTIDASGNLTFTPADDQYGTATVTVYAHDDGPTTYGETGTSAPQTFTITISPVNDVPSFTAGPNQTILEDAGAQTVSGFISTFSPGPNESSQTVDFIVTNNNNSLFSVQPAIAADGTLTYTPAANQNGTATVSVQIHDNGGGTDTSVVHAFTITVTAVNDAPSFTVGGDQSTAEDAGAQSVTGFISTFSPGPGESDTVNFVVDNDNNALFSVQPAIDATGNLTYTAAPNPNGSATVTVYIHDDGGSANSGFDTSTTQTFTLTITAVNDVPTFTVGGNQTSAEDAGAQTVDEFISTFSPGPSNESGQAVNFIVTNDNNSLFSVQPTIAADGTLTYTAAPNKNGSATVTVQIHDNAGGIDTSTTQTFTITVTQVFDAPVIDDAHFNLAENSAVGTVVGTIISTDPDVGDTATFTITSGNTDGTFAINPTTGQITVANNAALDFEAHPTLQFVVQVTDGNGLIDTCIVIVSLTNVAEPPVLNLPSAPSTFYIRHGQTVIDAAAAITGQESPIDFRGGKLTVQITGSPNSNDRLAVYDQDAATGKISVSGKNISFGSTVIGKITQTGSGGTALIITFNQSVTTDAINALLKVITYKSTSTTPPTAQRTISFRVENAGNSASVTDTQFMNVSTSPPSRAITISGNPTAYTNGAAAVVIAPTAIVTGPSTLDFDGARISVQITTGSNSKNKLGISNVGGITLVGSDVLYNGNKIGRATIGSNSLSVRLESINATPEAVQALTRAINFSTLAGNTSLAARVATFRLTDVTGATSTGATQTINVGSNT